VILTFAGRQPASLVSFFFPAGEGAERGDALGIGYTHERRGVMQLPVACAYYKYDRRLSADTVCAKPPTGYEQPAGVPIGYYHYRALKQAALFSVW